MLCSLKRHLAKRWWVAVLAALATAYYLWTASALMSAEKLRFATDPVDAAQINQLIRDVIDEHKQDMERLLSPLAAGTVIMLDYDDSSFYNDPTFLDVGDLGTTDYRIFMQGYGDTAVNGGEQVVHIYPIRDSALTDSGYWYEIATGAVNLKFDWIIFE